MTFIYERDVPDRCDSGERAWLCCFELSRSKAKVWKKIPPMLVEFCCTKGPDYEYERGCRDAGCAPMHVIPANEDGTLDWAHPVNPYCCKASETREKATEVYLAKLEAARQEIAEAIAKLVQMDEKIEAEMDALKI